jgi:anthranilate synthase/phosphoribosyltransferase
MLRYEKRGGETMILVIDNYDSFTYNLVQYLGELGAEIAVRRNDRVTLQEIEEMLPSHIVISPGPGRPEDGGISNEVVRHFGQRIPVLGVCLGHQCIGAVFGGIVTRAPWLMHGKTSEIHHTGDSIFVGLPNPFTATRYHSLIVEEPLPGALEPLAHTADGELMALRHKAWPVVGVQFHPESILTPDGKSLLSNFLEMRFLDEPTDARSGGLAEHKEGTVNLNSKGGVLMIKHAIGMLVEGQDLSRGEAEDVMGQIMAGEATPAQIGSFLTALRLKGETIDEIVGCARAMRNAAIRVRPRRTDLVDTCGTGGDGANTFNISTTAAFVVAGAGLGVAKHGNRSVSSQCGSADVLQALGVNLDLSPQQVADCIDEVGIGFLFAPALHPAMKHAIGPRREMGIRSIFNILGPLTNPANAGAQVMGVFDGELTEPLANVLRELGGRAAFVVHGAHGLDELSTTGVNRVSSFTNGVVESYELDPAALGLPRATLSDLAGGDPAENAALTRSVLAGEGGPRRDVVLLNAAAALVAGGVANDLHEGLARAAESIDSGQALVRLETLVHFTQSVSAA